MAHRVADIDPSLRWRILSAAVLAPAVLALVVWGGWPFALLAVVTAVLLAIEWRHLMTANDDRKLGDLAGIAAGGSALLVLGLAASGRYDLAFDAAMICAVIAGLAAFAFKVSHVWSLLGVLYLSLPLLAVVWLRAVPETGLQILLWLLFVVWATDIMAYVVGRWLGGRRLAPSISPGKTWAGFWGGIVGAAAVGLIVTTLLGGPFGPLWSMALAAALAGVAQAGDLAESALKRRAGVKDSGAIIPGHGGLLDRLDGLMFAAPALALVVLISGRQGWP